MKSKTLCLLILLGLVSPLAMAEDKNVQSQIDEVKANINTEQEANQKLKNDISAKDKEIAELKQKLKELEAKAATQGKK